ncbi:MAG: nitroreductase family protein [Candidatus Pelethousia sp.]|nr:nitroreductase family protein [Candidatus Pelethousia sp.]
MHKRHRQVLACALLVPAFVLAGCRAVDNANPAEAAWRTFSPAETAGLVAMIAGSYSCKNFMESEVTDEMIEQVLLCGAKAPSAMNSQAWHFMVAKNFEMVKKLASHAKSGCVAIIVSASTKKSLMGVNAAFDSALAAQNIYLAAQSLGLGAHMYASPLSKIDGEYREALAIPKGYMPQVVICIGQPEARIDAASSASARDPLEGKVNYAG